MVRTQCSSSENIQAGGQRCQRWVLLPDVLLVSSKWVPQPETSVTSPEKIPLDTWWGNCSDQQWIVLHTLHKAFQKISTKCISVILHFLKTSLLYRSYGSPSFHLPPPLLSHTWRGSLFIMMDFSLKVIVYCLWTSWEKKPLARWSFAPIKLSQHPTHPLLSPFNKIWESIHYSQRHLDIPVEESALRRADVWMAERVPYRFQNKGWKTPQHMVCCDLHYFMVDLTGPMKEYRNGKHADTHIESLDWTGYALWWRDTKSSPEAQHIHLALLSEKAGFLHIGEWEWVYCNRMKQI